MSRRQATDARGGYVLRDWVDALLTVVGVCVFAGLGLYTVAGWWGMI